MMLQSSIPQPPVLHYQLLQGLKLILKKRRETVIIYNHTWSHGLMPSFKECKVDRYAKTFSSISTSFNRCIYIWRQQQKVVPLAHGSDARCSATPLEHTSGPQDRCKAVFS